MSRLRFNTTTYGATPASGKLDVWGDSTSKRMSYVDDAGRYYAAGPISNAAIASQGSAVAGSGFASDTYVTNSDLLIPSFGLQAKTTFYWAISVSKSANGTATPVYTIRIGAARTTSDTSILAITGPAQTAAADVGLIEIIGTVRSIGSGTSAIIQGSTFMAHNLAATGLANNAAAAVEATSSGFNSTTMAGQYIGLTINGGASNAWVITQIQGYLFP